MAFDVPLSPPRASCKCVTPLHRSTRYGKTHAENTQRYQTDGEEDTGYWCWLHWAQDGNQLLVQPSIPRGSKIPKNGECIKTDLSSYIHGIILLHGIVSSGAQADLELSYSGNFDATSALLFNLAKTCPGVRVLYASSFAVYGTPVPKTGVTEHDPTAPEMSYGCQKVICETLIHDLTRRNLITAFPYAPLLSRYLILLIRNHLRDVSRKGTAGRPSVATLDVDVLAPHRRPINMPGFAVTIQDMLDALVEVGGQDRLAFVGEKENPAIKATLYSWADDFDNSLALSLGMKRDTSFVHSVRDYMDTLAEE
ncbi:hypothetical protein FB45DRAFT_1032399 [Roridomyces roridus]|uniref:NAD-dependent epimerase/dehydratase domain-containing protein n=1 Tax=Roridomyces roridus TaxID=1738132 RepID=A0AAD7FHY2_9AGAR|nr:hypothetical protein FB45DRAFT_1032399 [Roridomyces roridus]